MTIHQILTCFLHSIKHSSLLSMSQQVPNTDYRLLISFFHQTFDPQKLLENAWQFLFTVVGGWLILDEIVIEKSKEGKTGTVKRRRKSAGGYVTPSISIILLLWTDGNIRIPIRFELRNPEDGTLTDTTLRLLSWARNRLKIKPKCILFDAAFASKEVLKRVDDYGWAFVTRVDRRRSFGGVQIFRYKKQGYWNEVDSLSCGLEVRAARRANKFYISNRVSWTAEEVIAWYGRRHVIEEVFKLLKGECHWKGCQFSDDARYERFLSLSTVAFLVWEYNRTAHFRYMTIYQLRRNLMFGDLDLCIPDLEGILDAS
jgi:hypothetical protein